jgi:hypothetical protein
MKKYSAIIPALVVGLFVLGSTINVARAGDPLPATQVSAEDAAKKYPPQNGKPYPAGQDVALLQGRGAAAGTGGFIKSPYSSRVYDCRKLGRGALVLDEPAKKVFTKP